MKEILIVSHCFLNTAAKVRLYQTADAEAEEDLRRRLLTTCVTRGVQLLQLPCPELLQYGARRWGHTYEQFDNPFFRARCREMLSPVLLQLREYLGSEREFRVLGVLGIDGSPSCGVRYTCRGPWGGELCGRDDLEKTVGAAQLAEGSGVLMEEFRALLREAGLSLRMEGLFAPEAERALALLEDTPAGARS